MYALYNKTEWKKKVHKGRVLVLWTKIDLSLLQLSVDLETEKEDINPKYGGDKPTVCWIEEKKVSHVRKACFL